MPSGARAWCSAKPGSTRWFRKSTRTFPSRGLRRSAKGRSGAALLRISRFAAQRSGARKGRGGPRPAHDRARARRHHPPRADDVAGAGSQSMPALSLEMLRVVSGTSTILAKYDRNGVKSVRRRGTGYSNRQGMASSGFISRAMILRSIVSATNVLDDTAPVEKIRGKLVLIGTSAATLNDIKTTPVSAAHPGRRDPCPGAGGRAHPRGAVTTKLRIGR